MPNPSKGNTFSSCSAGRFPSSSPQRSHPPTDETLAVVDDNDPSITRNYGVGGFNFGGGIVKKPSCRVCNKTFSTLQAVYGHMQVHTERKRRGSRRRRSLAPSRSRPLGGATGSQGEGGSGGWQGRIGEGGSSSPVRVPIFDLNQPVKGAADPAHEGNVLEGNKLGFDLNKLPADED